MKNVGPRNDIVAARDAAVVPNDGAVPVSDDFVRQPSAGSEVFVQAVRYYTLSNNV